MEVFAHYARDALRVGTAYPYNIAVGFLFVGTAVYALKRYIAGPVCHSKAKLRGKTVIVTGANTGIGLETAVDMAQRDARVILACRNADKGKAAVEVVKKRSRNDAVVFAQLDLASLQSVRDFAAKIFKDEPHIDILINNAGVFMPTRTETSDGFELHFGVNHLAHFLVTNLLLDRLKEAPSARIINMSAMGYKQAKMNLDDLQSEKSYSIFGPYAQSKLANILFTRSLAQRLKETQVTAYSLHPGVIRTEIGRNLNPILYYIMYPLGFLLKTPWQGAQTSIYCAVQEGIEEHSGCYFADCKVKKIENPQGTDDAIAARLWQVSAQLVGLKEDNVN